MASPVTQNIGIAVAARLSPSQQVQRDATSSVTQANLAHASQIEAKRTSTQPQSSERVTPQTPKRVEGAFGATKADETKSERRRPQANSARSPRARDPSGRLDITA